MPYIRLPTGIVVHVRMGKPRRRRCSGSEGGHPCPVAATRQCDFQIGRERTCDSWVCASHATSVGPDLDHCPAHAGRQAGLFTSLIDGQKVESKEYWKRFASLDNVESDDDLNGEACCHHCGGAGSILVCMDDVCRGQGFCMHGDGEIACRVCRGDG